MPDVLDLFTELAAIPSPSGEERAVADAVTGYLRDCALDVEEDDAAERIGGTVGNLYARIEGTAPGTPIFLCAHLDTVPPTGRIEPVVDDEGVVRNAAGTILGADDKAAVAVMLEAARRVLSERRPHAGIELLFTPKEEIGLHGARAFDESKLVARIGFVYDQAAPIGDVILGAPYLPGARRHVPRPRRARRDASGGGPERDRSRRARDRRPQARTGRRAVHRERRRDRGRRRREHRPRPLQVRRGGALARRGAPRGARAGDARVDLVRRGDERVPCRRRVAQVVPRLPLQAQRRRRACRERRACADRARPNFILSGGAADANIFNERGLQCLNLGNGMIDIHTPDERIAVEDLEAMVDVTLALVDAALA